MKKDLLSMPAISFYYCRLTPKERMAIEEEEGKKIKKPYSLILSQATIKDFESLWLNTSSVYSCNAGNFIYFSLFDCCDERSDFENNQVLTVNTETGNYKWRKPYDERTLPK